MEVITLREAREAGLAKYFTGKPCKHGHIAERIVADRSCSVCRAGVYRSYRQSNKDKVKKWKRDWEKSNPEKVNARQRKRYARDPFAKEKHAEHVASWASRNKDVKAAAESKRRSRQSTGMPKWADREAIKIIYRAAKIYRESGFDVEVDHIVPLQGKTVSGLHVHNNLQIISAFENSSKSNAF